MCKGVNHYEKLVLLLSLMFITACSSNTNYQSEEVIPEGMATPNIMMNDRLYHTTSELYDGRFYEQVTDKDYKQEFEVDGTITSTVDGAELPEENNQSNFGTGYEYHIIDEDNVLVKIEDLWIGYEYHDSSNLILLVVY